MNTNWLMIRAEHRQEELLRTERGDWVTDGYNTQDSQKKANKVGHVCQYLTAWLSTAKGLTKTLWASDAGRHYSWREKADTALGLLPPIFPINYRRDDILMSTLNNVTVSVSKGIRN